MPLGFIQKLFVKQEQPILERKINSIYDVQIKKVNGELLNFNDFLGKKILIVNVASKCQFKFHFSDLQKLYSTYKNELVVIGVPCNQFANLEPKTEKQIEEFCRDTYKVEFILTEKISVKGENQHPLYQWLTKKHNNGIKDSSVKWNFQKYLIDEKGNLIDYWFPYVSPLSNSITKHLKSIYN